MEEEAPRYKNFCFINHFIMDKSYLKVAFNMRYSKPLHIH